MKLIVQQRKRLEEIALHHFREETYRLKREVEDIEEEKRKALEAFAIKNWSGGKALAVYNRAVEKLNKAGEELAEFTNASTAWRLRERLSVNEIDLPPATRQSINTKAKEFAAKTSASNSLQVLPNDKEFVTNQIWTLETTAEINALFEGYGIAQET